MHEFSIATALIEQVDRHTPPGATLSRAKVSAGAMQAIEPDAMQWAWTTLTAGTRFDGATLDLLIEPFTFTCPDCGNQWQSADLFDACSCGCARPRPTGSHAITLLSLSLEESPDAQEAAP